MPGELVTRFNEAQAWCSLEELCTEVSCNGTFLAQKLRNEGWSNVELESRLILAGLLRSAEPKRMNTHIKIGRSWFLCASVAILAFSSVTTAQEKLTLKPTAK